MSEIGRAFLRFKGQLHPRLVQASILLSGTTLSQVVLAAFSPVLTRLYHPDDFGIFALVNGVVTTLGSVACLKYETAIVLPHEDKDAANLLALCLALCIGSTAIALVTTVLFWTFAPAGEAALIAAAFLVLAPIGVLLLGVQFSVRFWWMRHQTFGSISLLPFFQSFGMVVSQTVLGYFFGSSPFLLLAGALGGIIAASIVIAWRGRQIIWTVRQNASWPDIRRLARAYASYPLYTLPHILVTQASARGILIILALLTTSSAVGQFALAQRVIYLPIPIIVTSVSQIFYSLAAQRLDDRRLVESVRRSLIAGSLALGPLFAFVMLFARPAFAVVFGARWGQAGMFASLLTAPSLMFTMTSWLDRVYDIRGRQWQALTFGLFNETISLGALVLVLLAWHDAVAAVAAYAACVALYCIVRAHFTFKIAKFGGLLLFEFLAALGLAVVYTLAAFGLARWFIPSLLAQAALTLVFAVPVIGAGAWIGARGVPVLRDVRGPSDPGTEPN